nr:uncharacterized protein LOC126527319 [Dermacentor andersoni]
MDVGTLLVVVCIALLTVAVSVLSEEGRAFVEQQPIDPIDQRPYSPGSVGPGGYCQSTRQCRHGWCCVRQYKHGDYTCQKMLGIGRRCSSQTEVKAGLYLRRCPCVSHLRCRGTRALKLCLPKNWWPDAAPY